FQAEDGIRDLYVTGVQTCALPIYLLNVFAFVQGSGEFVEKVLEPKITYKFERGGEYLLELRDLTSRNGGPDFRYRVVIRPQIPRSEERRVGKECRSRGSRVE